MMYKLTFSITLLAFNCGCHFQSIRPLLNEKDQLKEFDPTGTWEFDLLKQPLKNRFELVGMQGFSEAKGTRVEFKITKGNEHGSKSYQVRFLDENGVASENPDFVIHFGKLGEIKVAQIHRPPLPFEAHEDLQEKYRFRDARNTVVPIETMKILAIYHFAPFEIIDDNNIRLIVGPLNEKMTSVFDAIKGSSIEGESVFAMPSICTLSTPELKKLYHPMFQDLVESDEEDRYGILLKRIKNDRK